MTIAGVAPWYRAGPAARGQSYRHEVHRPAYTLVSGQSAADFAKCAENLAHGFGALLCRVRTARSGAAVLEFTAATRLLP